MVGVVTVITIVDLPNIVTRPVIANSLKTTRLNCRKVVFEIRGVIGCNNAKMSVMGFCSNLVKVVVD
jgi:hypothetical protein